MSKETKEWLRSKALYGARKHDQAAASVALREFQAMEAQCERMRAALQGFVDWVDSRLPHGDPSLQQLARVTEAGRAALANNITTGKEPAP
jgi:hypothetical protein